MFTDHDLRDLLNYARNAPVLSVYLSTDPAEGNADAYKLRLRSMLKEIDLPEDVAAVLRYFDREHDWSGRSVVLFSCAEEDYFKVYTLQLNIRSRVRVSDKPFVKPLLDLLDFYGGYGVVLVDKQGARLFSFQLGELQERDGVLGESIRRTKRGGGSQATGRRGGVAGQTDHMDEITDRNIKETVGFATEFFSANNVRRILIGGADDTVALFRSQLPKTWQSLVVGTFPMSMTASQNEVLERSLRVGEAAERKLKINWSKRWLRARRSTVALFKPWMIPWKQSGEAGYKPSLSRKGTVPQVNAARAAGLLPFRSWKYARFAGANLGMFPMQLKRRSAGAYLRRRSGSRTRRPQPGRF